MIKVIELVIVIGLLAFSFFAGVKYSEAVKEHAGWLFESKGEEEIELPDLSGEGNVDVNLPSEEIAPAQDVQVETTPTATPAANAPAPVEAEKASEDAQKLNP